MAQDTPKLSIRAFKSGINQSNTDALTKQHEAVKAYNVDMSNGTFKPIKNSLQVKSTPVKTLIPYYGVQPSDKFLMYANGTVLSRDSGTINGTLASDEFDYITYQEGESRVTVLCNGVDNTHKYNGTLFSVLLNRRPNYNEDGSQNGWIDGNGAQHATEATITTYAPKGRYCELHYNRLWISGVDGEPDRVYFSNDLDIDDFTIPVDEELANQNGGFVDIRSYDGSRVIGIKKIFDDLLVFKERSIYKIYGYDPSNYSIVQSFDEGSICDKSIATGSNRCFFLNNDGIYQYDGVNTTLISSKIKNVLRRINKAAITKSVSIFYNNKYILSVPVDSSTTNNLFIEYDTINNSFMTYEGFGASSLIEYDEKLYYTNSTGVYVWGEGTTYAAAYWETPFDDFGYKNSKKNTEYLYFYGSGTGTVKFTAVTDKTVNKSIEIPITESKIYRKKLKHKGRIIKLIIENISGSNIEVSSPEWTVEIDFD